MRKLSQLIVLISSFFCVKSFAQSTTILPSRIDVPNVAVLPTCDANGKGRMVYNTGDNKMYFCNGTAWTDMTVGGFTLPYSGSGSVVAPNFLFNVSNSGNGRAITGETSSPTYGTGVYGASTNTAPSSANPSSIGVFGINNSQNSNGIGIYGQHDGNGKGIYGVVKNSGIGVHGIGLPVSSGGSGFGIGVKGESTNSYGVQGVSFAADAVYGTSTSGDGVKGISSSLHGGHFETTSSTNPALYVVNNSTGPAAQFNGDVNISSDLRVNSITPTTTSLTVNSNAIVDGTLTVNNGKGVVYNSSNGTNLKIYRFSTQSILANLAAHASSEVTISFVGGFTQEPMVFVGNIASWGGASGEPNRVILQVHDCSFSAGVTSCTGKVVNTDGTAVNYSTTWNMLAIGN